MKITPPISLISNVIKLIKSRLEREYTTFKLLKKAGVAPLRNEAKSIYFHCLLKLENTDPKLYLLVKESEIEKAFFAAYDYFEIEEFERVIESNLHTNPRLRSLKQYTISPTAVIERISDLYKTYLYEAAPASEKEALKTKLGIDLPYRRQKATANVQLNAKNYPKIDFHIPRKLRLQGDTSIVGTYESLNLRSETRILLLGSGGSGKTVELRCINASLLTQGALPYFISLKTLTDHSDIADLLPEDWSLLDKNSFYVILDGLDETGFDHFIPTCQKILRFAEMNPSLKIVLSCRSVFFQRGVDVFDGKFKIFELEGVDIYSSDTQNYVKVKYAIEPIKFISECHKRSMVDLVSNPFFLERLGLLYKKNGRLPDSVAAIFDELTKESLSHDHRKYGLAVFGLSRNRAKIERALQRVALVCEMMCRNDISEEHLNDLLKDNEVDLLNHIMIFRRDEARQGFWKFEHNNFQENLAAKLLASYSFEQILDLIVLRPYKVINPSWANTVIFVFSALDGFPAKKEQLMNWLYENDIESIIPMETDKIHAETRLKIFKIIFNKYKERGIWFDTSKYTLRQLARFARNREVLHLLLQEMVLDTNPRVVILNAIHLVEYLDISEERVLVRESFYRCIDRNENDAPFLHDSLYAMDKLGIFEPETMDWIMTKLGHRFNQHIRAGMYKLIESSRTQAKYLDFLIQGIKYIGQSRGEDRDNIHVFGEELNLIRAISDISDPTSIKKVIQHLRVEHRHSYGHSFQELYEGVINASIQLHGIDNSVYVEVFEWFKSLSTYFHEAQLARVLEFFDQTNSREKAFKQILADKRDEDRLFAAVKLFNGELAPALAACCNEKLLSNDELERFFLYAGSDSGQWGKLIKGTIQNYTSYTLKDLLKLDHEAIQKEKLKRRFRILFRPTDFVSEALRILEHFKKDPVEWNDIWEISRLEYRSPYTEQMFNSKVVDFLLHFAREDRSVSIEDIKAYFHKGEQFDYYRIEEIRTLLSNNKELEPAEEEVEHIRSWCEEMIPQIDFSRALQTFEEGRSSHIPAALTIWFFAYKLNLDFGRDVTLDLLFMLRLSERDLDEPQPHSKLSYFTTRLNIDDIKARMVANLEGGISDSLVILQHFDFLISHQFNGVEQLLRKELLNEKRDIYHRSRMVDFFDRKDLDVSILLNVLHNADFSLRWEIVKKLNRTGRLALIEEYLLKRLHYPDNDEDQVNAAEYLVRLNNLVGIEFFITWLKKEEAPRDAYSNRHECISQIAITAALPFLFELLDFSYQTNRMLNVFDRLDRVVLDAIENIAQSSDEGFQLAISGLNNFMETSSRNNVNFLYFNVERIKKKYFGKIVTSYSFKEAVLKLKELENA